jgi:hypothetical protein
MMLRVARAVTQTFARQREQIRLFPMAFRTRDPVVCALGSSLTGILVQRVKTRREVFRKSESISRMGMGWVRGG